MPEVPDDLADVVFRVGRAYAMTADRGIYQAVAVRDGRITAVGRSRDELDSFIRPGTVSTVPYNHYALLRSIEDLFGLVHLGYAAQPGLRAFGPDVYTQPDGPGAVSTRRPE